MSGKNPRMLAAGSGGGLLLSLTLLAWVALIAPQATAQTLAGQWAGQDEFVVDTVNTNLGGAFAMHFISTVYYDDLLYTYYITGHDNLFAVGLATSSNGLTYANHGYVLDVGGAWQWAWEAEDDLYHQIGRANPFGDGWSADVSADNSGYMVYGPYSTAIAAGDNTASFELLVDNNTANNALVVTVDVYDATAQQQLASRQITRREFGAAWTYQVFNLDYTQTAGHSTELRTFWHDQSFVAEGTVAVSQGQAPFVDNRIASFPDVWLDDSTWYMVYEGAGTTSAYPGDICLATSTDGVNWIKDANNPILTHNSTGWESVNIGTPSLYKEGSTWYLFYHGYNGSDCQVGVATGTSLTSMTKYGYNPVVAVSANDWDSGTIGKRSIVKEGNYYYMVYEGSTDPPYGSAEWSSGLARATSLFSWTKWSGNPVLPVTQSGFGYDGPNWVTTPNGDLHIYYRSPASGTCRATLTD